MDNFQTRFKQEGKCTRAAALQTQTLETTISFTCNDFVWASMMSALKPSQHNGDQLTRKTDKVRILAKENEALTTG